MGCRWAGCSRYSELYQSASQILAAFISTMLSLGMATATGIYYPLFSEAFSAGKVLTAWSTSLTYTMLFLSGPLTNIIIARLGLRKAAIVGGLTSSIGLLVTSFANSIFVVLVFLGVVTGLGYGILWNAAISVVSLNFVKYRKIAISLSVTGVGVGSFSYPLLVNRLVDAYGWRGSVLITSGLTLHLCAAGALMRDHRRPATRTPTPQAAHDAEGGEIQEGKSVDHNPENVQISRGDGEPGIVDTSLVQLDEIVKRSSKASQEDVENEDTDMESRQETALRGKGGDHISEDNMSPPPPATSKQHPAGDSRRPKQQRVWCKFAGFTLVHYVTLHVNAFLVLIGLSVVFTHVTAYAQTLGHSPERSRALIAAQGLASLGGRLLVGAIAQLRGVDIHLLYACSFIVAGIAVALMTLWTSFVGLVVCMSLYGVFYSTIAAVMPEVIILIVGVRHFSYAYGFIMLTYGLGYLLGAPFAGWLYDVTQMYTSSFIFGASAFILSGLVMLPPWIAIRLREKKEVL